MLRDRVSATIRRYGMLEPGDRVAVAVSGGADSVCLLHLLHELAPAWNLTLSVVHLNHKLRGSASDADAAFVANLAASLNLTSMIQEVQLAPGNLEQAGREARLASFRKIVAEGSATRVATAHTRSDQAETVLYRFLRGSGTAGLSAIRPVTSDGLIRPMIEVDRPEVEEFLKSRGISWREDQTNLSMDFARNRIRHVLLPALAAQINPSLTAALARTAEWAQTEEEYWDQELDRIAPDLVESGIGFVSVNCRELAALHPALARRVLRRAIEQAKGDLRGIGFVHVESVLELARGGAGTGRVQIPGLTVTRSFDWLRFGNSPQASGYRLHPPIPGVARIPPEGPEISLELIEKPEIYCGSESVYNMRMGFLDWQRLSGSLVLRNWLPGDRFQPLGSAGEHKLKTLFQKERIPAWERSGWPVLLDGNSIVWARRFGPAAAVAATPSSKWILAVCESPAPVK